jgi:hypothetical protein
MSAKLRLIDEVKTGQAKRFNADFLVAMVSDSVVSPAVPELLRKSIEQPHCLKSTAPDEAFFQSQRASFRNFFTASSKGLPPHQLNHIRR